MSGGIVTRYDEDRLRAFRDHLALDDNAAPGKRLMPEQPTLDEYAKRIDHLRLIVEEEGGTVREDSERDFWDFVGRHPFAQPGQIVVTHEGHLRLIWKGDNEEHIGIRFPGDQMVRYVIFSRRADETSRLETAGEDSFDGLVGLAHAYGLDVFRA